MTSSLPVEQPEPLTERGLATILLRTLEPTWVTLLDHSPAWADYYAVRAAEVRAALGERARLIEHIGSTSVPGLAAKPIVDIVVGIDEPENEKSYLPDLTALGYEPRVREPGHRCLRIGDEVSENRVNLHCYPPGSAEVRKYLLFRDRLRSDKADRELYERTKRELATRQWPDINFYADAKGPVIREILTQAGWC